MHVKSLEEPELATVLWRGVQLRCPRCGVGRLLSGYLRQAPACSGCGLETGDIRADDGPPWLTLLVTGHLLAPFMIIAFMTNVMPMWLVTLLMAGLAVGLCLAILPRAKGVFIAAIWKLGAQTSADLTDES
ncbi:DUF983 domain-containing protein [Henriciella aquimarina]|uniref:DUF983 domain-containing protein n=1 Tax=Henriciella aquimarina TaxID=545261 RepID=UPI001301C89C|nr:DUF983 domain-containing protein [Henriciella aquimarina]